MRIKKVVIPDAKLKLGDTIYFYDIYKSNEITKQIICRIVLTYEYGQSGKIFRECVYWTNDSLSFTESDINVRVFLSQKDALKGKERAIKSQIQWLKQYNQEKYERARKEYEEVMTKLKKIEKKYLKHKNRVGN